MSSPNSAVKLELIKLRDCYPYRQFYEGFAGLLDEGGTLDYASEESRERLDGIHDDLHDLGFRTHEITTSAAIALCDLSAMRQYIDYVEDPGDILVQA